MNPEIVKEYRRIRKDHVARYTGTGYPYHHKVTASRALRSAKRNISICERWESAKGHVRLITEPDPYMSYEDLAGDAFNPRVNPSINPTLLEKQKQEFIERINREGVYTLVGQYICPCCGEWTDADSCGGFVGDDWKGSGYDLDIMTETIKQFGEVTQ